MDTNGISFSSIPKEDLIKFIKFLGAEPTGNLSTQAAHARKLFHEKYNYPYEITFNKSSTKDNYNTQQWPRSVKKLFYDKYIITNTAIKFKKFDSEIDGYMSIAQTSIKLYKDTKVFTVDSDLIDEYYSESFDIYKVFVDEVMVAIEESGVQHEKSNQLC